ncbi:MAG: HINT domain-containing protein [Phycisphaeraceae bacterium]|nr:HINT domain-containing protein [Phycisphaeraceae bacterium]
MVFLLTVTHQISPAKGGWVVDVEVRPGDLMLDKQGDLRTVDRIERVYAPVWTYNLTVMGSHKFFPYGMCVHKGGSGPIRFGANANLKL